MTNNNGPENICSKGVIAFILIGILAVLVYGNTLQSEWHMDDHHNILNNPGVRIKSLWPSDLTTALFGRMDKLQYKEDKLRRPLAKMTFAMNWYFGGYDVLGFHLVNIAIHFTTAFILFLTIGQILRTPNARDQYQEGRFYIALLGSVIWLLHPIQTQAVTYIVQRMAAMAAMFYVLGLYCYVKGRLTTLTARSAFYYGGCLLSYLAALGCKENAAVLPLTLVLAEIIFFQDMTDRRTRRKWFWWLAGIGIGTAILCLAVMIISRGDPVELIFRGYDKHTFTLAERLLTEPRVILLYLSQLFYPVPNRLSLEHDIEISTSLFTPWTTFPSIVLVMLLIGMGIRGIPKRPLLAFAILFYFLNHLVESTILPLALVFEHRNYLPSLFLFVPVACGLLWVTKYYRDRNRFLFLMVVGFQVCLLIGLGYGTYNRNSVWATSRSLWEDAVRKAPRLNRPLHNLAFTHYERLGQRNTALMLYRKSLDLKFHNKYGKSMTMDNMAGIHYLEGRYKKAAHIWRQALELAPEIDRLRLRLAMALIKIGHLKPARAQLEQLVRKDPENYNNLWYLGMTLMLQDQHAEAADIFRKCLKVSPTTIDPIFTLAYILMEKGAYKNAQRVLNFVPLVNKKDDIRLIMRLENSLRMENAASINRYCRMLLERYRFDDLTNATLPNLQGEFGIKLDTERLRNLLLSGLMALTRNEKGPV